MHVEAKYCLHSWILIGCIYFRKADVSDCLLRALGKERGLVAVTLFISTCKEEGKGYVWPMGDGHSIYSVCCV